VHPHDGEGEVTESRRLTPRRGKSRDDAKEIKIPDNVHRMLCKYAQSQNMTFGRAVARLIRDSMLEFVGEGPTPGILGLHFDREMKQVKVPKGTHASLFLFASYHSMTIGDAAALLIGVSLMERYNLHEDAATGDERIKREKSLRTVGEALAHIERQERQQGDNAGCNVTGVMWLIRTMEYDQSRQALGAMEGTDGKAA
jgi:hypothetical protein